VSTQRTRTSGRDGAPRVMDRARPESYYGRPIIAEPTWTWEIPFYFFFGGMAGAAAPYALLAELRGEDDVARRAWLVALLGIAASPGLLISDLGRPERFHHMLRVFKVTSPMSVGSWILSATGGTVALGAARSLLGRFPRLGRVDAAAAVLGPALASYTAVLVADTSVPVWHRARRELPFVFTAGGAMSAGAAVVLAGGGGSAPRVALLGAAAELTSTEVMERRLGELIGEPYHTGVAGRFARAAKLLTAGGAVAMAARRRRPGAALMLAGALSTRWGVYEAGRQSALDPKYVVASQREAPEVLTER
jgi:Polysulphide reductase, NrfD